MTFSVDEFGEEYKFSIGKVGYEHCPPSKRPVSWVPPFHAWHFVLFGRGTVITADGKMYKINRGESFLLYQGEYYNYYPDPQDPWTYIWVELTGENLESMFRQCGFTKENFHRALSEFDIYGELSFLSENFPAMEKFISAREATMENGLVARGHEYGDWLAMDGEALIGNGVIGRTDVYFLTNVLHAHSLKLTADAAALLGKTEKEQLYRRKYEEHLARVRDEYVTKGGRLVFDTITAQAVALYFGIIPEERRAKLAALLNENVLRHGCRMVTGFIGSPFLLYALTDNGYWETARRVLLNNGFPGWLYEVDMGATTIWERWNSLMPDGTPNPDGMNSYNHYAYGSVMEFVYRRIAGIETRGAGFAKIKIAPHPMKGLPSLRAEYESVRGKIASSYTQKDGKIEYVIELPEGAEAEIVLPDEKPVLVTGGKYTFKRDSVELHCEPYTPESTVLEVFENPKAVKAFNEVFGGIFTGTEIAWMKGEPKTLQFMAQFRDMEKKMKLSDFPQMLKRANELFQK